MLIFYRLFAVLIGVALAVLVAVLWPKQITGIENCLNECWWKAGLWGLLIIVCLLPFLILLVISILGIPLILLVVIVFLAAALFGKVGVSVLIGRRLLVALGRKADSVIAAVIIGEILLGLVRLIPAVGPVIKAVIIVLGIGAVFMTRFGTAELPMTKK